MTIKYYLPILDKPVADFSGQLVVNGVVFESYNGATPTIAQAISTGAIKLVPSPFYTNAFSLAPYGANGLALKFANGYSWPAGNSQSSFPLQVLYSDISWYDAGSNTADLFVPVGDGSGSSTEVFSGGSGISIEVKPLIWPAVNTQSSISFPADNQPHTVYVTLARPLHVLQNPTVSITKPGSIAISPITATKDATNHITGWTFTATASSAVSGNLSISLTEPSLQYLKNGIIVTEAVTYVSDFVIGTISTTQSAPTVWNISSFGPPSAGTNGFVGSATVGGVAYYGYAGFITITGTVQSDVPSAFVSAKIVGKQVGSSTQFDLATMTPVGSPSLIGSSYYQTYTATIDTGVAYSNLVTMDAVNIGMVATNTSGTQVSTYASQQFLNRNLDTSFANWWITTDITTYGEAFSYTNVGLTTGTTSWSFTSDQNSSGTIAYGYLGSSGTIYLADKSGQKVVLDPALDNIQKVELWVNGALWITVNPTVRVTGDPAGSPLMVTPSPVLMVSATPYSIKFRLFPKSTYGVAPGTAYLETPTVSIRSASNTGSGSCFAPNTYVLTSNGPRYIKDLVVGQMVKTISEANFKNGSNTLGNYTIQEVFKHTEGSNMISINGISTTLDHLWATEGGSFVTADILTSCATVNLGLGQSTVSYQPIFKTSAPAEQVVYNLHVDTAVTYLVAPSIFGPWKLVHNSKGVVTKTME